MCVEGVRGAGRELGEARESGKWAATCIMASLCVSVTNFTNVVFFSGSRGCHSGGAEERVMRAWGHAWLWCRGG